MVPRFNNKSSGKILEEALHKARQVVLQRAILCVALLENCLLLTGKLGVLNDAQLALVTFKVGNVNSQK